MQNKVNLSNWTLRNRYSQLVLCYKHVTILIGFPDPKQTVVGIWLLRSSCNHQLDLSPFKESLLFGSMVMEVVAHFTEAVILKPCCYNSRQNNLLADFVCNSYSCKTFCVYPFGVGIHYNLRLIPVPLIVVNLPLRLVSLRCGDVWAVTQLHLIVSEYLQDPQVFSGGAPPSQRHATVQPEWDSCSMSQ